MRDVSMVRKIEAKIVFATLVFTCGASVVCAQDAGVSGAPQPAAFDALMPVDVMSDAAATPAAFADPAAPVAPVADMPAPAAPVATAAPAAPETATVSFDELDIFGTAQPAAVSGKNTMPSEQILGSVDDDIFKEMAAIERETALLTLKAKRERLLSDIEKAKADLRKNQMDEMERREQISRDRVKWEMEQEELARKREEERLGESSKKTGIEEQEITTLYTVNEIKGVNGELGAVLQSDRGSFSVTVGHPLKNGYKVSKITTSSVEVSRGRESEFLLFTGSTGTTGAALPRSGGAVRSSGGGMPMP